jgi:hypothetical protein
MSISYTPAGLLDRIQSNNNMYYTNSYIKKVRESDDDVESFQEKFQDFRKAVRNLHNYSSADTTNDKLKKYLTKLTDTYNSMVKNKDSLTDSSLQKHLDKLDSLIDDNAKSLKKLGLNKTDGKLEFDEDTFDDDADQKTIDKLFTGTDSFIDQAYKLMRKIDKSANDAQYVTNEYHLSQGVKYSNEEIEQAKTYLNIQTYSTKLNVLNKYVQDNQINNTNKIDVFYLFDWLKTGLNSTDKNGEIETLYNDNKENLDKLGFSYDEDNKKLIYTRDDDMDMTEEGFKESYAALFGDSTDFRSKLDAYCKEGYSQTMQLETIGVDISV